MSRLQVGGTHTSLLSGDYHHPCHTILEDYKICVAANTDVNMCLEEKEDYNECVTRKKELLYWSRINAKLIERKIEYQKAMGTYNPSFTEGMNTMIFQYLTRPRGE